MITTLQEQIAAFPPSLQQACNHIFYIDIITGYTDPPPTMYAWIERQFGSVADVREQTVVHVTNRLTLEGTVFNPLRARRLSNTTGGDQQLDTYIAQKLAGMDHFRNPLDDTPADLFGRIRGRYCTTASNIAKYEGLHGLVIFDEPHPLHFDTAHLCDYLDVAFRWIIAAHTFDPQALYPIISWNCLPKSGATQMHGHMQIALARGMHYPRIEAWRRAATTYRAQYGTHYINDLYAIHEALGLTLPRKNEVRSFAHLTPVRNREVVLLAENEWGHDRPESFPPSLANMLYAVLHGLIEQQGMRAFNLLIALPPLKTLNEDWTDIPIIARIADRGDPLTMSSDLGALELFATNCIVTDPFEVATSLRKSIRV